MRGITWAGGARQVVALTKLDLLAESELVLYWACIFFSISNAYSRATDCRKVLTFLKHECIPESWVSKRFGAKIGIGGAIICVKVKRPLES